MVVVAEGGPVGGLGALSLAEGSYLTRRSPVSARSPALDHPLPLSALSCWSDQPADSGGDLGPVM
jgi:hypothetical protein